jgi:mono/diheme cytochrome c family protein
MPVAGLASAAAISCAAIIAAGTANGQDAMPPRGDFALTVSLTDTGNGVPVTIGDGRMAVAVNQTAEVANSGGAFLDGAVGTCTNYLVVDTTAATIDILGYCNYRDADGDVAFEQFATDGAVALDGITMAGEWIGGTGKYESLEGTITTTLTVTVEGGAALLASAGKTGNYTVAGAEPEVVATPAAPATPATPAADGPDPALFAALMQEGQVVFERKANCDFCHGGDGQGSGAPALAGNGYVRANASFVGLIFNGYMDHGMPAFGGILSNREIAAVATYVRNSWGNEFGITTEATVAQYAIAGGE